MSDWDFLWDLDGQEYLDAMATGMTYYDSLYIDQQGRNDYLNTDKNNKKRSKMNNSDTIVERFQKLHSEIIEYFQCIEYDMKRIYSAMDSDDFDDNMDWLANDNWGVVLGKLKKLDNSDGDPLLTEEEYNLLDEIREIRNYWCHQCYVDWVYIDEKNKREKRLERLTRQLENEHNRVYKLHRKMEKIYLEEFAD